MSPVYVVGMLGFLINEAMPMCAPTEYTIYIERQECNYCVAVNTTICMGFCFSRVSGHSEEKICITTFSADPLFTYPVALSCHCSTCHTHSDECAHKTSISGMKCSKPVHHLYPENNYIQVYWEQYE
ncbi:thyrotropin subunit beta-like [Cyprinus carpio]|uniref:Thyrotropin subunit beta n=1 Tax=Cyprinus carpio TaxID=7962 RepID=A0A9R0B0C0_CYPCA|nr:thyrotropin subunit beta-like [Cyprinus carpio]